MSSFFRSRAERRPSVSYAAIILLAGFFLYSCGGGDSTTVPSGNNTTNNNTNVDPINTDATCGSSSTPSVSAGDGTDIAISGKAEFVDLTYDQTGFTGTSSQPIRYATIQVLVNGSTAATATTDANGDYSLSFAYTSGTVYVRALTQAGGSYSAKVMDNRDSSIYAVRSDNIAITSGDTATVNLCAGTAGAGPAFNIYDILIMAQKSLLTLSTQPLQLITAYWYDGSTDGTYYTTEGTSHVMYILGASSDSDAYDDSVVLHEMGHYAGGVYSQDDSPGGIHQLTGHYDLRLTWSEGWASFFQSLIKDMEGVASPELYVDTIDINTLSFSYEIETPSFSSLATGADNEVAVSAVLWDIYDVTSGSAQRTNDSDALNDGYSNIWSIFQTDLPKASVVTFETFYDYWVAGAGRTASQLSPLLSDRDIRYSADSYESDNTAATARAVSVGISESHTFFPAGDKDYWKISVTAGTTYTFQTSSLGDGADTLLTLYDSDGTMQLAQDDDIGDSGTCSGTSVASRISWTANATKTVYLAAETYRPLASGDLDYNASCTYPSGINSYGHYTLTIQ